MVRGKAAVVPQREKATDPKSGALNLPPPPPPPQQRSPAAFPPPSPYPGPLNMWPDLDLGMINRMLDELNDLKDKLERRERNECELHHDPNMGTLSTLMGKLTVLEDKGDKIELEKSELQDDVDLLEDNVTSLVEQDIDVIDFVEGIEKANQFFHFKNYLKGVELLMHKSDTLQVFKLLVQEKRVQDKFDKLDFKDINEAIQERVWELEVERLCKKSDSEDIEKIEKLSVPSTECEENERLDSDPIMDLVYAIRNKDYVMDKNPLVELEAIRKSNFFFYIKYFTWRRLDLEIYSAHRVLVSLIPIDSTEDDVKDSLSACGEIVDFEMKRGDTYPGDELGNIAYVTFRDSEAAKIAPILMDKSFNISPAVRKSENYTDVSPELNIALKKTARKKYEEIRNFSKNLKKTALKKYEEFRNFSKNPHLRKYEEFRNFSKNPHLRKPNACSLKLLK